MWKKLAFLLAIQCLIITTANAASESDIKARINQVYAEIHQAFKQGDVSHIGERFYTDDALFYPPIGGEFAGPDAITEVFQGMLSQGLVLKAVAQEVEVYGDAAFERGVGYLYDKKGNLIKSDNYMVIWKPHEGKWKMYRDMVQGISE